MNAIFTTDDRALGLTKSTAARMDVPLATSDSVGRVGDAGSGIARAKPSKPASAGTQALPVDTHSARLAELAAQLAEDPDNAELLGRRDAHKHMANPDPCDWEAGIPLPDQSDRVQEYLRGYEAELKHERAA